MKPIIGVIPLFDEEKDSIWMVPGYMEGIRAAGGLPIILPLKAEEQETEQVCDMWIRHCMEQKKATNADCPIMTEMSSKREYSITRLQRISRCLVSAVAFS